MSRSIKSKKSHYFERNNRYYQQYSHRIQRRHCAEAMHDYLIHKSEFPNMKSIEYKCCGVARFRVFPL